MTGRARLISLILPVLLGWTPRVFAQPETVVLLIRPRPGDTFLYAETASSSGFYAQWEPSTKIHARESDDVVPDETREACVSFQCTGFLATGTVHVQSRYAHRVLDVSGLGVALVEIVIEDLQSSGTLCLRYEQSTDCSPPNGAVSGRTLLRVRPDGTVVERAHGTFGFLAPGEDPLHRFGVKGGLFGPFEFALNDYPIPLPDRAVAIGDTWRREAKVDKSDMTGQATAVFTLVGLDRTGPTTVARIRSQVEVRVQGIGNPFQRWSGIVSDTQEIEWQLDQGRVLRTRGAMTLNARGDATGSGRLVLVSLSANTNFSTTALAASELPRIAVPEEARIAPGQGIGSSITSASVEDFSRRLGTATARAPDNTYRARSMEWPRELVGFVDLADADKLIGLQVTDRQFRTENGIDVGSSRVRSC